MTKGRLLFVSVLLCLLFASAAVAVEMLDGPEFGVTGQGYGVTFMSSTASMSHVEYGETEDYGQTTEQIISLDSIHEHVLQNVKVDTTYAYRIVLADFAGAESVFTGTFTTPGLGAVSKPHVQNTSDKGAFLSWEPVFGAAEYQVQRASDEDGPFEVIATVTQPEYFDEDIDQIGENVYRVVPITSDGVAGEPSPTAKSAYVMVDIAPWANNLGIARIQNVSDLSPGLDGDNFGFSAEVMPQGDFELIWQNNIVVPFRSLYLEKGQNDNIRTTGQVIEVPRGSYSTLWLLVASSWGESTGINIALNYADGSEAIYNVSAPDWCQDGSAFPGMSVFPGARYNTGGQDSLQCSMWLLPPFAVNGSKELVSIRLPQKPPASLGNTDFHIFGLTLGV